MVYILDVFVCKTSSACSLELFVDCSFELFRLGWINDRNIFLFLPFLLVACDFLEDLRRPEQFKGIPKLSLFLT